MARKLRYQPENVCYHVVTRIAHREFFFDDAEKDIVFKLICNVERFTGVSVIAYAILSNHLHLLLFIDKPATLRAYEEAGYFLGYKFEKFKEGDFYRVTDNIVFSQQEVNLAVGSDPIEPRHHARQGAARLGAEASACRGLVQDD